MWASPSLSFKEPLLTSQVTNIFPLFQSLPLSIAPASETLVKPKLAYHEELSKHRMILPLYDLHPRSENAWVAPNATISKLSALHYQILSRRSPHQKVLLSLVQLCHQRRHQQSRVSYIDEKYEMCVEYSTSVPLETRQSFTRQQAWQQACQPRSTLATMSRLVPTARSTHATLKMMFTLETSVSF